MYKMTKYTYILISIIIQPIIWKHVIEQNLVLAINLIYNDLLLSASNVKY